MVIQNFLSPEYNGNTIIFISFLAHVDIPSIYGSAQPLEVYGHSLWGVGGVVCCMQLYRLGLKLQCYLCLYNI